MRGYFNVLAGIRGESGVLYDNLCFGRKVDIEQFDIKIWPDLEVDCPSKVDPVFGGDVSAVGVSSSVPLEATEWSNLYLRAIPPLLGKTDARERYEERN